MISLTSGLPATAGGVHSGPSSQKSTPRVAPTIVTGSLIIQQDTLPPVVSLVGTPEPLAVISPEKGASRSEKLIDKAKFLTTVRKYVSGTRTRVRDGNMDLDMTYITPRIIGMSFPAKGIESMYRNPRHHVISYLRNHHANRYLVFNLCAESSGRLSYDPREFSHENAIEGAVCIPIKGDNVPSLYQISNFCQQAMNWLNLHPENVVVVHCVSGKGRTGVMIASLLISMGEQIPDQGERTIVSAQEAIDVYASAMGGGGKFFTPSQIRWIRLYYELLSVSSFSVPISIAALGLAQYVWTLDSVEIGPTRAVLHAITVRRRNEDRGIDIPLPELFKQKMKSVSSSSFLKLRGRRSSMDELSTRNTIHVDFPVESRFSSREDCELVLHMRKGSMGGKSQITFWFPAEISDQMVNHRVSTSEGHSTLFLTALDFDHPDDVDKNFNVINLREAIKTDTSNEITSIPNAYQRFYVKINVRYTKL